MSRFYPKGFIGSEKSLIEIARTRDPERWKPDAMSASEQKVWNQIGTVLNATFIYDHLPYYIQKEERNGTMDRYCDFMEALKELRKSLFEGETIAFFTHEDGKIERILKEGWGGDQADDILLCGIVSLEGGLWGRTILIKADEVEKLARSLPPAWPDKSTPRSVPQTIKQPAAQKRETFRAWRGSLSGRIPTLAEDIEAMRKEGINRDDARELRREHPSLPRGKPKAK